MENDLIHFKPKSIFFQAKNRFSSIHGQTHYVQMFLEDLSHSIMPIGGKRNSGKQFNITITPFEQQKKVNILFSNKPYSNNQFYKKLEEIVSKFINDCVKNLLLKGTQYYEIVPSTINFEFNRNNLNISEPVFVLSKISGNVLKFGKVYIQIIPKSLWGEINKKFIILSANSVWKVTLPKEIDSLLSVQQMLNGLIIAGKNPTINNNHQESFSKQKMLEINNYYLRVLPYVAFLTKSWGWDIRSSFRQDSTEFHQIYRRIVLAYKLAIFREKIINNMNLLLLRIGYNCQIELSGLPTSTDVSDIFTKLKNNEISFVEAFELTSVQ